MIKLFVYFFACVGLLIANTLSAQDNKILVLEKKLATANGNPKVDVLNQLAEAHKLAEGFDQALNYAQKAEKLAKSLRYEAGLAESYHQQGSALASTKKFKESIVKFKKSFEMFKALKLDKQAAKVLNKLGGAYFYNQEIDKAIEHIELAIKWFNKLNDGENVAQLYGHLGIVHAQQSKLDKSLEYYTKAKDWYQKNEKKQLLANVLVNMSEVYIAQKKLSKAIHALQFSYQLFAQLQLRPQQVTISERLGYNYGLIQKHDSSAYYYEQALALRPKTQAHAQAIANLYKKLAGAYFYQKIFDKALDYNLLLVKYLETVPDKKAADEQLMTELVNVGLLYDRLAKHDQSIEYYKKSLELRKKYNKTNGEAALWVNIGATHLKQKKYEESFKAFSRSLKMREAAKDTSNMLAVYGHLVQLYNDMKDFSRVARVMEKMLSLRQQSSKYKLSDANKREFLKEISRVYYEAKKFEKVYFYQNKLLQIYKAQNDLPNQAQGMLNLGVCAEQLKRNSEAIDYYTQAAKLFNQMPDKEAESKAFYNVANLYQKLQNQTKALEAFKQSLVIREELNQKQAIMVISNEIAQIYIQQKKFKQAIPYLKKADNYVEKPANAVKVLESLTLCYFNLKEYSQALEHLNELIKLKPKDDSFRQNKGLLLIKMKKYQEALTSLSKAIELGNDLSYVFNRGRVYIKLGQPQKAIADYNTCVAKVTNSPDLYCARGLAYIKADNLEKAEADLNKAAELAPALPALQVVRAAYSMAKKQPEKAIEYLQKAVKQGLKDKESISDESLFTPLRDKTAYKELMNQLGGE